MAAASTATYQWYREWQRQSVGATNSTYTVPGRLECGDVRVHVGCHVRQLQCDVEQCDGDGESHAERDDQCEWFDESVRWVFEWADTHLEREWMHEHGDVSVARKRQPNQRCDECDVRCAEWFERGDVRVHGCCHMRQLQCDVEQCDGDGESRAERDDQCEWSRRVCALGIRVGRRSPRA